MNDEFEKRLQRQPIRELPSEWREEILRGATPSSHSPFVIHHSFLSTLSSRLSTLLWPHPKAWAGLAAAWIVIAVIQFTSSDRTEIIATKAAPPSSDAMVMLQRQNHLLAELFEEMPLKGTDRPKHGLTQPRSERRMNARFA
jgi:hypothetical protein